MGKYFYQKNGKFLQREAKKGRLNFRIILKQ